MVDATHTGLCRARGTITDRDRMQHRIAEEDLVGRAPFDTLWPLFSELRDPGAVCAQCCSGGRAAGRFGPPRSTPDWLGLQCGAELGPWLDTLYIIAASTRLGESSPAGFDRLVGAGGELQTRAKLYRPGGRRRYHSALYDALASALLLTRSMMSRSQAHDPALADDPEPVRQRLARPLGNRNFF